MKKIYSFYFDCGRQDALEGVFIEDSDVVDLCIGMKACFGEVLGKHSDVYVILDNENLSALTDDKEVIDKIECILGIGWESGYNPIDVIINQLEYEENKESKDIYNKLKEMGRI